MPTGETEPRKETPTDETEMSGDSGDGEILGEETEEDSKSCRQVICYFDLSAFVYN